MMMEFFDLEDSGFLDGPFTEDNAEAIGTFDKANGYVGAICDIGEISYIVSPTTGMGSVDAVVSYLVAIAAKYFKAYPGGLWAFSFNNQNASSTTGKQAAEIQNGVLAHVGITAPFFDAEGGYDSPSATIDMVNSFNANYDGGLLSDMTYSENMGWSCTTLQQFLETMGGAGSVLPQAYCTGQLPEYQNCGVSGGFLGVTVSSLAADTSLCGSTEALGYQGGINQFYSLFKTCPSQVLVVGAWHAGIDSSTLTCS